MKDRVDLNAYDQIGVQLPASIIIPGCNELARVVESIYCYRSLTLAENCEGFQRRHRIKDTTFLPNLDTRLNVGWQYVFWLLAILTSESAD